MQDRIQKITKERIIKQSCILDVDIPLMLTFADIESNMGINLNRRGSQFKGAFQIGNSYSEDNRYGRFCQCDFMFNIECSLKCVSEANKVHKDVWQNNPNYRFSEWHNWFYFGLHNQGRLGFKIIYENRDKRIGEISHPHASENQIQNTQRNMLNNPPVICRPYFIHNCIRNGGCECLKIDRQYRVKDWYNEWAIIVNWLINYYTQELQKPEYQKIIEDCKFSKQLNNPQPKEIESKDIHYKPPVEVPKSKFQQDIEAMQEQYAQYKRLEEAGLFASFNNSQPISKKSNKNDRNYELRQLLNPSIRFVNSPTANINVPVDASGNRVGGVEITSGDISDDYINIDRQTVIS